MKPPAAETISAWSRETSLPASRRSLVSRRPMPNASLAIGTIRRPSASVTSRRASGMSSRILSNAERQMTLSSAAADDADDQHHDRERYADTDCQAGGRTDRDLDHL